MKPAVRLERVVKRFGAVTAVDGISLLIPRGAVYGFLGPNGAGKTTTIRMIMNIIRPDAGTVEVLGGPAGEEVKTRIGYLPEERGVYQKMRVLDLVTYFGVLKGLAPAEARRRGARILEELELGNWLRHRCRDLSKGMQQKLQFASTVVHDPELLILDEPFSGLDPVNVEVIKDRILALRRAGTTVLFSTHIMDQAERLCDSVVLIHRGRKVLDGSLEEVQGGTRGEDAVVIEYDGDGSMVSGLDGVARVNDFGKYMEVYLEPGASAQRFLEQAVGRLRIRRFEVRRPTLNEIFIRAVRGHTGAGAAPETTPSPAAAGAPGKGEGA